MTDPSDDSRSSKTPSAAEASSISFPCRRCRYEIRGISLEGLCPECGEPIRRTLSERVDLTAATIDPDTCRRIGRLLPIVGAIVAVTVGLATLPPAAWPWTEVGGWLATAVGIGRDSATWGMVAAMLWTSTGLAVAAMAIGLRDRVGRVGDSKVEDGTPPAIARPLGLPRTLLATAAGLCFATAASTLGAPLLAPLGGPLVLATTGVLLLGAGLLAERLGPGSRRWRGGGSARQSPWLVVASLAAAGGLSTIHDLLVAWDLDDPATLAGLLATALVLLTVVGGLYLAANLLWVGSDLRRRQPGLERMLIDATTTRDAAGPRRTSGP